MFASGARGRPVKRLLLAAALALSLSCLAAEPRGRDLYELRCHGCHAESVHARTRRVAKSFEDVRGWVVRWNKTLRLAWSDEEIDEVTLHLNTRYYRFACPPTVCKVVSQAPAASPASH